MNPLFAKLNLGGATLIHVLDSPESFEPALGSLAGVRILRTVSGPVGFALAFVRTLAEVEKASAQLTAAAEPDAILWMVYPKGSSKKYTCEFNRDTGWARLGQAGYEPVRQVAIDEDWTALRFRRAEFIKSMKRNPDGAISPVGREKARNQR